MTKWRWVLKQFTSKLWFRASIFCGIGILTALAALLLKGFIPENFSHKVGADAVDSILEILASSMLAVTTFSLSTVVAAYAAASSNATPRATKLLLEDSTAQNALSTFIGSFLFSLVGIIALHMGVYGESGRLVLFVVTLGVIFIIVAMLLQWIEHLSQLGRIGHTVHMVEKATQQAFAQVLKTPCLGGTKLLSYTPFPLHQPITHPRIGYIQYIDMEKLSALATKLSMPFFIQALPGHFNDSLAPILYCSSAVEEKDVANIREAFHMGDMRSFDQDPRYGLIVLGEIASRALSPAVNDPGTAIVVTGTAQRILSHWARREHHQENPAFANIHVPPLTAADLLNDVFTPIARDGAGMVEVGVHLQKAYGALAEMGDSECAKQAQLQSALALTRAFSILTLQEDKDRLEAVANSVKRTPQKGEIHA